MILMNSFLARRARIVLTNLNIKSSDFNLGAANVMRCTNNTRAVMVVGNLASE